MSLENLFPNGGVHTSLTRKSPGLLTEKMSCTRWVNTSVIMTFIQHKHKLTKGIHYKSITQKYSPIKQTHWSVTRWRGPGQVIRAPPQTAPPPPPPPFSPNTAYKTDEFCSQQTPISRSAARLCIEWAISVVYKHNFVQLPLAPDQRNWIFHIKCGAKTVLQSISFSPASSARSCGQNNNQKKFQMAEDRNREKGLSDTT